MLTFIFIWFGQVTSIIGSGLTGFALGVWVYQTTGSTTQFSLIYLFTELPAVLVAPVSGAIADRWNRRWIMILADTGSGISTLTIALLLWFGKLEIWHIYLAMAFSSICKGFQDPTYRASLTLLVPKKHFGRANGMIQLGEATGKLFSPVLAGILLGIVQLQGIILIDFVSFGIAILTLLFVRFPKHRQNCRQAIKDSPLWQEIRDGLNFILERSGLVGILIFFAVTNFTIGLAQVLITPMILGFTNTEVLGAILSIGGSGYLFGAILMSTWGGPKQKVRGIFGFEILLGLAILLIGLRPSPTLITLAAFLGFFSTPMIVACAGAIRQVKVPLELQGRVFAIWGTIAWLSFPSAYITAGPLADYVFQPLLLEGGILSDSIVGSLIGVGEGRGIGLLFILVGIFVIIATIIAYQYPRIRFVEDELPDIK